MDKTTKIFLIILGILFIFTTIIILFGGYSYQLKDLSKSLTKEKSLSSSTPQASTNNFNGNMLSTYTEVMHEKISSNWNPPSVDKDSKVILEFTINKNGRVIDSKIYESSGNKLLDESALKALRKASPLPPLPMNIGQETLTVKFDFTLKAVSTQN